MTGHVGTILIDLARRGIRLRIVRDRLRVSPRAALTPDLVATLSSLKVELLDAFIEGFGRVPPGWSKAGWCKHLRDIAAACEHLHPQRAEYFRCWVESVNVAKRG